MDYKELDVWKETKELVKLVYEFTNDMPSNEQFGLTLQVRRAAVSIPSNIAEGIGRNHTKDTIQFLLLREVQCSSWKLNLSFARRFAI